MLILRGAPALSAFRHGKLLEQLSQKVPAVTGLYAEFAHFADVDGELTADQQQVLGRLLKYGPSVPVREPAGRLFPWSRAWAPSRPGPARPVTSPITAACRASSAGARYRLLRRRGAVRCRRRADRRRAARPHDPARAGPSGGRSGPVQPRPAQADDLRGHSRRWPCRTGPGQRRPGPGPGRRRDRLPVNAFRASSATRTTSS